MSIVIYWKLVNRSQLSPEASASFLSPSELQKLASLRFPKRRDDWLFGRWAAKSLIHGLPDFRHFSLSEIEIQNTPEGAPRIHLPGMDVSQVCLSTSHSDHFAFCALTTQAGLRIGADVERIEPRADVFTEDYFTPAELKLVGSYPVGAKDVVSTLIWSTKESMLKALGVGLRLDTRRVEILKLASPVMDARSGEWYGVQVGDKHQEGCRWAAWWQPRDDFLLTVAGFTMGDLDLGAVLFIER